VTFNGLEQREFAFMTRCNNDIDRSVSAFTIVLARVCCLWPLSLIQSGIVSLQLQPS